MIEYIYTSACIKPDLSYHATFSSIKRIFDYFKSFNPMNEDYILPLMTSKQAVNASLFR